MYKFLKNTFEVSFQRRRSSGTQVPHSAEALLTAGERAFNLRRKNASKANGHKRGRKVIHLHALHLKSSQSASLHCGVRRAGGVFDRLERDPARRRRDNTPDKATAGFGVGVSANFAGAGLPRPFQQSVDEQ